MFLADIRYCTVKDARELFAIEEMSFSSPWPFGLIRRDLEGDTPLLYLGAWGLSVLLGYAVLGPCKRGAELANIAVHPDHRRKGIGSQLLVGVSEVALSPGRAGLCLHVRASNREARAFYEKHSFASISPAPGYYADGEDALLMESALPLHIQGDAIL